MNFSLPSRTVSLSVGEFANFSLGPSEDGGGTPGLWRAQLGQHWHNELQKRTLAEAPDALFEVPIDGQLTHRGWTFALQGRIDQQVGSMIREIKSVLRPLPADEPTLRADYPAYFLQLAAYVVLLRATGGRPEQDAKGKAPSAKRREPELGVGSSGLADPQVSGFRSQVSAFDPNNLQQVTDNPRRTAPRRAELVFVEAGAGLVQTVVLTPFDEALVFHQLDAIVEFLNLQLRAAERRHHLQFHSPFTTLRPGQETIQADLLAAMCGQQVGVRSSELGVESPATSSPNGERPSIDASGKSRIENRKSKIVLLEAPTGYGKTGCVLEFALGQLKAGRYDRLIWLTGKSTGQIQVMATLRQMAEGAGPLDRLSSDEPTHPEAGFHPSSQSEVCHTLDDKPPASASPQVSGLRFQVSALPAWQIRNKAEHCVNHEFHCVRDSCDYLRGVADRWPGSGLSRFYTDDQQPRDLDSLRDAGRRALVCPYEITRAALPFNDVWIGDFNYVFAPDNRGVFFERPGFDPARTLLVVDEAHNLPSRVAGAFSLTAIESDVRLLLAELDHLRAPPPLVLAVGEWARLLASLRPALSLSNGLTPAESLDPLVEADVRDQLTRLAQLAANTPLDYAALGPHHSETLWSFVSLHTWLEHARLHGAAGKSYELGVKGSAIHPPNSEHLTPNPADGASSALRGLLWVPRSGQLEFTCLDAAAEIGATLREFGGVILMSATLQPYAEFAESCGLENVGQTPGRPQPATGPDNQELLTPSRRAPRATTLHAPTPWRAGAYDVAVDLRVDTSFRHRATHYRDTAATIVAMAAAATVASASAVRRSKLSVKSSNPIPPNSDHLTPNSATRCVAVFFPSYAYAEAVQKTLDDYGSVLRVALQPKLPDLAAQTAWVEENLALSDVLFLVLGSSFAEGIDLLGGRVTHAMVVGPALPEVNAVQKAKLAALDHLGRDAAFRRVYQIPGLQKVNQALGRLVRAPGQHAKVLLHCRRFADPSYSSLLATDYQFYREIADEAALKEWLSDKR